MGSCKQVYAVQWWGRGLYLDAVPYCSRAINGAEVED